MLLSFKDFNKLINRLRIKIVLLIGRSILAAINNSGGTQKVQVVALYDETISGIERFQEYGLETYPKKDAEILVAFINGNRDQGIALCAHDRRYRPRDLSEGDVAMYTDADGGGDHRIHLCSGKKINIVGEAIKIGAKAGHKALCIEDLIDTINDLITVYNSHTHTETGGVTLVPNQLQSPLIKADHITQETEAT